MRFYTNGILKKIQIKLFQKQKYPLCLKNLNYDSKTNKKIFIKMMNREKKLKIKMISPYKAIKNLTKNLPKIK